MHGDLVHVGWFRDETAVSRKDIDLHWLSFVLSIRRKKVGRDAHSSSSFLPVLLLFPYKTDGSIDLPGRLDGEWHDLDAAGRIELGRKIRGLSRALGIGWPLSVAAGDSDWVVGNWEVFTPTANAEGEVKFVPDHWIWNADIRRKRDEDPIDYVRRMLPGFQISDRGPAFQTPSDVKVYGKKMNLAARRPELPFWVQISFQRGGRSKEGRWNVGYEDVHGPDAWSKLRSKVGLGRAETLQRSLPDMLRVFWRDVMKIFPESERIEWVEKNVEPFQLGMDLEQVEVFKMLGERLPVLWFWPEFEQWAAEQEK